MDAATIGKRSSVDRKLPAFVVAESESFTPKLKLTIVPDILDQGVAGRGAGVGGSACLNIQFVEGCLCRALVAKVVVGLGLDENHLGGPDEREISDTRKSEHIVFHMVAKTIVSCQMRCVETFHGVICDVCFDLSIEFLIKNLLFATVDCKTKVTLCLVNISVFVGWEFVSGEEQGLADIIVISDLVCQINVDSACSIRLFE